MADLKKTLPPFVGKTRGIGEILTALEPEVEAVEQEARQTCLRLAAETADEEGLRLWEQELGLEDGSTLDGEARRELIRLALEQLETCTPRRLCAMLERLGGGEAALQEDFSTYTVHMKLRGSSVPPTRLSTLQTVLRRAAPAHLLCLLETELAAMTRQQGRRALIQGVALEIHTTKEERK